MGKNKGGRPLTKINWEEFDKLCALQCTLIEIASWFNCSDDTIENVCKRDQKMGFSEYFKQKAAKGKMSLRRKQYELAMAGDKTMLIWLGKQYLGQAEKLEQTQTTTFDLRSQTTEQLKQRLEELKK